MPYTNLLLVDDDSNNLKVIADFFENEPYEIMYAPNGEEGFNLAKLEKPDLILSDWAMPLMNGLELVLKLKAKADTQQIPIVMATGVMTSSEDLKDALEAGAVDFVRKPYDKLELISRIRVVLRLQKSFRQIEEKNDKIQALVAQRDRELSAMSVIMHEHTNFLSEIKDDLKKHLNKNSNSKMRGIYKKIKAQINSEDYWTSFMHHFEKVHPEFFTALQNRNNALTTKDLKLAAYKKIGLSNKEIANITGTDPASVKSNFYRLKKKLNLDAEESLTQYLLRIMPVL